MELKDALAKAGQILDEERVNPTLSYEIDTSSFERSPSNLAMAAAMVATISSPQQLQVGRSQRPRAVEENPRKWIFKSGNYNLLSALYSQVSSDMRSGFMRGLFRRIALSTSCAKSVRTPYPGWYELVSELPLVAEFGVRNGATHVLLSALTEAPLTPGVVIMLRQFEEMVALNFTVFSEAEFDQLKDSVLTLNKNSKLKPSHPQAEQTWAGKTIRLSGLFNELVASSNGIIEQCRKAKYFYLKQSLLQGLNIEINQDKDAVQSQLKTLGFSGLLAGSLDEAERLYLDGGNAFNLKASMGHLRSFLENLHKETFAAAHAKFGGNLPSSWGDGVNYLRDMKVLSTKEQQFVINLYAIISDQAVHALVAERQYARLFRNVVIEYALLFLWRLEALGVTRQ